MRTKFHDYSLYLLHKSQYNMNTDDEYKRQRLNIGEQIRERRKELSIKQSLLAEYAEVSVNTLYKIERGEANPTLEVLCKLLDVLGLKLNVEVKHLNE